jgi:hypothetical protein
MLWESGETLPRKAARIRLATIFELPCDYFLHINDISAPAYPETADRLGLEKLLFDLQTTVAQSDVSPVLKKSCTEAISRALQDMEI